MKLIVLSLSAVFSSSRAKGNLCVQHNVRTTVTAVRLLQQFSELCEERNNVYRLHTFETFRPTQQPTSQPTQQPTTQPTDNPTEIPSQGPTEEPTEIPTEYPTVPTLHPSEEPTTEPTQPYNAFLETPGSYCAGDNTNNVG